MGEVERYSPPDGALGALARCLLPTIRAYFDSEQGQREFAEWKARRDTETAEVQSEKGLI